MTLRPDDDAVGGDCARRPRSSTVAESLAVPSEGNSSYEGTCRVRGSCRAGDPHPRCCFATPLLLLLPPFTSYAILFAFTRREYLLSNVSSGDFLVSHVEDDRFARLASAHRRSPYHSVLVESECGRDVVHYCFRGRHRRSYSPVSLGGHNCSLVIGPGTLWLSLCG